MASKKNQGPPEKRDEKRDEKQALLETLRRDVEAALEVMTQAAKTAKSAATHEEMKPENDKDTRGIEAGYLAAGQAKRAGELRRTMQELAVLELRPFAADDAIGPTALVELKENARKSRVFMSPHGGGLKVKTARGEVQVVTPLSPLGDALLGKHVGDVVELNAGGRLREIEVVGIS